MALQLHLVSQMKLKLYWLMKKIQKSLFLSIKETIRRRHKIVEKTLNKHLLCCWFITFMFLWLQNNCVKHQEKLKCDINADAN